MRILFTVSPLSGHLLSLLPLLRAASAAGHQVVVATGPDLIGELQRRGHQTWSIGPSAGQTWAELQSGPPPMDPVARRARTASVLFGRPGVARVRDLLTRATNWAPDVMVHSLLELAGAEVAARLGVREIVVGPVDRVRPAHDLLPLATTELAATLGTPDRYAEILAAPPARSAGARTDGRPAHRVRGCTPDTPGARGSDLPTAVAGAALQ